MAVKKSTLDVLYDGQRLEPAPQISIKKNPTYNNGGDNILSNTFEITLSGYASSVVVSEGKFSSGFLQTTNSLERIQYILEKNGKKLEIYSDCEQEPVLIATGGMLTNFNVEEGVWYNYAKYTATYEFSEVSFKSSSFIGADSVSCSDKIMANMMYKLKSYNDNWNFVVPENESRLYFARLVNFPNQDSVLVGEDYSHINVSYTITAEGKDFYYLDDTSTSPWESAKNFVQYKMWNQINAFYKKGLLGTPYANTSYDSNERNWPGTANDAITSTNVTPAFSPVLSQEICNSYDIFNESIECSTSEASGSFTATYTCVLKRSAVDLYQPRNSLHTYTVDYNQVRNSRSQNRTITVSGSVKGMLRTRILQPFNDGQNFVLPRNGRFFDVWNDAVSAYGNAYEDFVFWICDPDFADLKPNFKAALAINYESLFPATQDNSPCVIAKGWQHAYQILALPKDFTINYNYGDATIEYTAVYDTERSCAQERGFSSLTITEDDAVPIYAEQVVVGRTRGPILQDLNTNQLKTVTIEFDGVTRKTCLVQNPWSRGLFEILDPDKFDVLKADVCDTDAYTYIPLHIRWAFWATEQAAWFLGNPLLLKDSSSTYKPSDGTYNIRRTYQVMPDYPTNKVCPNNAQDPNVGRPPLPF